ncbi:hypothetical protein K490DRAFT_66789 [Saccharata proteae CBS 121410]|uniref:HAUS augmin-like complex subunit 1 n=1 Tax=Saccharata proteae CBS 121410 TaxID=1314787 RepID=A0A9P4HV70_9PEZI|nr:hypothetical protein K490DRAFT_66789 [Saccharata proteae CBS 121410]
MDNDLSPDALFSPSKARQQRAQAHNWQHVETWLSSLYPNRALPAFERTDETLKALLALAAANERADEERRLVEALEEEVRIEAEETDGAAADFSGDLLGALTENLTEEGEISLNALAALTTALSATDAEPETLAHALISQTKHSHHLAIQQQTVSTLHAILGSDLQSLRAHLRSITSDPSFTAPANLPRQTADYTRQTKQFRPKLREYADRLNSLPSPGSQAMSSASLDAVKEKELKMEELKKDVARMEARVKAFRDLPADRDEARQRVRARERELEALRRERDAGFGKLVER